MSNHARELHDLLVSWGRAPGQSMYKNRGSSNDSASGTMWANSLRATRLLDEIRDGLRKHELLQVSQVTLNGIAEKLFQPEVKWSQSGGHQRPDPQHLSSLMSWAFILDHDTPRMHLDEAQLSTARTTLQEAREVLDSVPGMNEAYRAHIGDLLVAVLGSLNGETPDLLSARAKFHEAVGAMLFQPEVRKTAAGKEFIKKLILVGTIFLVANVGLPIGTTIAADVGSTLLLEQMVEDDATDGDAVLDGEIADTE